MRQPTKYFLIANIAITLMFTAIYISNNNFEFLAYAISTLALIGLIVWSDKKFAYPKVAYVLFTIWLLLHMLGGYIYIIHVTRLYDLILVPLVGEPYNILKYDQLLHFFCYFAATFFTYKIVKTIAQKNTPQHVLFFIAVLMSMGIGGINEVIEFGTVVFFNASGVGGYVNTGLDLVSNLLGALFALFFVKK